MHNFASVAGEMFRDLCTEALHSSSCRGNHGGTFRKMRQLQRFCVPQLVFVVVE